jgi:cell division protein FtsB
MRELEKKQRTKKRIYSIPVLVILLALTVLLAKGTYGVMKKRQESSNHVETLKAKLAELEDRKAELNKNIDRLSTPEGVDREIKEKFSVSKEGEEVAIIVDPKEPATTTEVESGPFYKRWWNTVKSLWED